MSQSTPRNGAPEEEEQVAEPGESMSVTLRRGQIVYHRRLARGPDCDEPEHDSIEEIWDRM